MPAERLDVLYTTPATTEGGKDSWWKIGVAFMTRDGSGYTLILGALPIPYRAPVKLMLMDPNRFGDRGNAQRSWQTRTPPGPRRPPMPIDRNAPQQEQEEEDDGWPGPR